jgi:hypothetical protein
MIARSRRVPSRRLVATVATGVATLAVATSTGAAPVGASATGIRASTSPSASIAPDVASRIRNGPTRVVLTFQSSGVIAHARATAAVRPAIGVQRPTTQRTARVLSNATYLASARAGFQAQKRALAAAMPTLTVLQNLPLFPVEQVRVTSLSQLQVLAAQPGVARIALPDTYRAVSGNDLTLIKQPAVKTSGDDGKGTAVAVLDTGVNYKKSTTVFGTCPGAKCKVPVDTDFAPDDNSLDNDGHGTNVASLVLKVAPQTRIIAGDVFHKLSDGSESADDSDIQAGLQYVADHAADYNIKAVNLSLGDGSHHTDACTGSSYESIFSMLVDLGVQPVIAAGNFAYVNGSYTDGVASPACVPGAFVVGAVYDASYSNQAWGLDPNQCTDKKAVSDQITCFSQGGPLVNVVAPGSYETGGSGIPQESGTSQATPHVAGAIAALASGAPGTPASEIAFALQDSGKSITDSRTDTTVPRIDMTAAQKELYRGAVVSNGVVGLGINQLADLNVPNEPSSAEGDTTYGLRLLAPNLDYVSPGCPCEGWGIADLGTNVSGYADESSGTANLNLTSFTHTATTAKSIVVVPGAFQVTHSFHTTGATKSLFQVDITVKNISAGVMNDVVYRRLVDWDMEPTAFSEYVTINKGTSKKVRYTSDNGFSDADPLVPGGSIDFVGNATLNGPDDHGALFDIALGKLAKGSSVTFHMFYGAAPQQAAAQTALKAVSAQAYSLGEPMVTVPLALGGPGTAILAFTAVGGTAIKF